MSGSFWRRFTGTAHTSSKRSVITHGIVPPGIAAARAALGWSVPDVAEEARPIEVMPLARSASGDGGPSVRRRLAGSSAGLPSVGLVSHGPDSILAEDPIENWERVDGAAPSTPAPGTPVPGTPRPARRRAGGPLVPPSGKRLKGSLGEALRVVGSQQAMHEALIDYNDSIYAPQTVASKSAMRSTWVRLAKKLGAEPLPVTVELVHQIASALKAAGYKAAGSYLNEALQWHRREGHPVSDSLEIAVKDAKRAVTRAIGPKRRAAELKIQWIATLLTKADDEHQQPAWPNHRALVWILGYHFVLREVELSCLFIEDVSCDLLQKQITLRLPVSKVDPTGRGCRRTLSCECKDGYVSTCVFCNGLELLSRQESALLQLGLNRACFPKYPLIGRVDDPREVVNKADFVEALRWDAGILHDNLAEAMVLDPQEVTGHSLRRSGCKGLARKGVPLELIQFMSRHSSQAVMDYVEDALEECPNMQFKMQEHMELRDQVASLVGKTNSVERGLDEVRRHFEQIAHQWQFSLDQEAILKLFDKWARPKVVANMSSKKLHSAAMNNFRLAPSEWVTDCGWKWTTAGRTAKACVELADVPLDFRACDKCKPRLPEWAVISDNA